MTNRNLALITGGAKRIGCGIAEKLASLGYDIAITYNHSKDEAGVVVDKLMRDYGVSCDAYQLDLLDLEAVEDFSNNFFQTRNCNLLVNNASIFAQSSFLQDDLENLEKNMNIHLNSPLILSKAFAHQVQEKSLLEAQIINLIDKNIVRYETKYFHYLLSKKTLAQATKMLALQLAPNIRCNGIGPGYILEPIDGVPKSDKIINKIPLQRKGNIDNIVSALEFLLKNDFVNGQIISIDGGASLNHAG